MRNKRLWLVAVVAMAAAVIICSACEKKSQPEVIGSEIISSGIDKNISVKDISKEGVSGKSFEYNSWLVVNTITKSSENRVVAHLSCFLKNTDTTITVNSFEVGEGVSSVEYRVRNSFKNGAITTTDTVLVYKVSFGSFAFEYEFDFEVAVYDDGFCKQVMPYYAPKNIKDNGFTLTSIESVDDGVAYTRRLLKHSVSVEMNGKKYELVARVILQKDFGPASQKYLKSSKVVSSKSSLWGSFILSYMKVRKEWSDGTIENKDLYYNHYIFCDDYFWPTLKLKSYANDMRLLSAELVKSKDETIIREEDNIVEIEHYYQYRLKYNYFENFVTVGYSEAWYDDGVLRQKFELGRDFSVENGEIDIVYDGETKIGEQSYYEYYMRHPFNISLGELKATTNRASISVLVEKP